MPSVTRQSLVKCKTKGCPFTPDEHEEWMSLCRQAPEHGHRDDQLSHQHLPKKGMGGHNSKSKIVSILCWPMHDRIDNKDWGNAVRDIPGRGRVYFAWDLHGNTLIERDLVPEEGDEGVAGGPISAALEAVHSPFFLEGLVNKEEGDGLDTHVSGADSNATGRVVGESAKASSPDKPASTPGNNTVGDRQLRPVHGSGVLTHEQRVAIAQEIKDTEWNRQWYAGDTGNQWIAELGESAEQYLSDFGYVQESLANILRVCAAIPPPYRNGNLRFSHHVVVYQLPREDQMLRLMECEEEQWSVAEFRRQVKGTKPRVKRWSLEELRTLMMAAFSEAASSGTSSVEAFFDWLERR